MAKHPLGGEVGHALIQCSDSSPVMRLIGSLLPSFSFPFLSFSSPAFSFFLPHRLSVPFQPTTVNNTNKHPSLILFVSLSLVISRLSPVDRSPSHFLFSLFLLLLRFLFVHQSCPNQPSSSFTPSTSTSRTISFSSLTNRRLPFYSREQEYGHRPFSSISHSSACASRDVDDPQTGLMLPCDLDQKPEKIYPFFHPNYLDPTRLLYQWGISLGSNPIVVMD